MVDAGFSTTGLLRLAAATGLEVDYAAYTPDLESATRLKLEKCQDYFLMDSRHHAKAKSLRDAARKFHRKYGLARIDDFLSSRNLAGDTEQRLLLETMLTIFDKGWIAFHGDAAWYLFDDKQHAIKNASEKVLAAVQSCDGEVLAEACRRSLAERNYHYPFASEALIHKYLTTSTQFDVMNGRVQCTRRRSKNLTAIDSDLVNFLNARPQGSDGHEIRVHLQERWHRKYNIRQRLGYSPLLQRVAEPRGPGRYTYFLVGTPAGEAGHHGESRDSHYALCKDRLIRLDETDDSASARIRTEQRILREWLFDGKDTEDCALCGKRFIKLALVAAHKKKREECDDAERRDPHIVMPLCKFGCDFVYEERYVTVRNGTVETAERARGPRGPRQGRRLPPVVRPSQRTKQSRLLPRPRVR